MHSLITCFSKVVACFVYSNNTDFLFKVVNQKRSNKLRFSVEESEHDNE